MVSWECKPPPALPEEATSVEQWPVAALVQLPVVRSRLRHRMMQATPPADADTVERLLLALEELASNGLRHGRPPVQVTVAATAQGWLIDVTDTGIDQPPTPAVDRDPCTGGLGLYLVAQICANYGWSAEHDRKHVWAYLRRSRW